MRKLKGFTLIELLVVISIIALLLAILMPALGKVKEKAKLLVCSSNQHQLIIGVITYSTDSDDRLPPSIAERRGDNDIPFTWPCVFNYMPGDESTFSPNNPNNGGSLYYYLGSYFPTLDVFRCPNGPRYDEAIIHDKYVNYTKYPDRMPQTSYNLYWGGWSLPNEVHRQVDRTVVDRIFAGPKTMADKSSILVSDMMNLMGDGQTWRLAHLPRKGATPKGDQASGAMQWEATLSDGSIPDIKINAGYKDGHVERFDAKETINIRNSAGQFYYVPPKWR